LTYGFLEKNFNNTKYFIKQVLINQSDYRKYLIPSVIAKLSNLELKAKQVVEGFMAGLHKSPYHGFSVEFA